MLSLVFAVTVMQRITGTLGVGCCGYGFTMIYNKHCTFFKWLTKVLYKRGKSNSSIYFYAIQHSQRSWGKRHLAFNSNLKLLLLNLLTGY